jgi:RimJ/RimL family protein N-acetyltransferase
MNVSLRPATVDDLDFLELLDAHEDVDPFLGVLRARGRDAFAADVERATREPDAYCRFVIEVDGRPAGMVRFEVVNRRSAIAEVTALAVHPDHRGRGVADEAMRLLQRRLLEDLGLHRIQLEVYAFNVRAQRLFERVGFVREGARRRAYLRDDDWVDGILYGLVAEDR